MKSRFDMLFEANFTRFQGGGFLTGDIIKLREGWANDDWCKSAPQQVLDTLKQLDESDLVLRVSSVKAVRPTVNSSVDQAAQIDDFHVDITQESAPGRFSGIFVTLPQHLIELNGANDKLPEIPDSLKKKYDVDIKPQELEEESTEDQGDMTKFTSPKEQTATDDKVNKQMTDENIKPTNVDPATSYTAGYMG